MNASALSSASPPRVRAVTRTVSLSPSKSRKVTRTVVTPALRSTSASLASAVMTTSAFAFSTSSVLKFPEPEDIA